MKKSSIVILLFLTACNPYKKAAKSLLDAQQLADKVISSMPPVIKKDSLIFIPGADRLKIDTVTNFFHSDTVNTVIHYINNVREHTDTIKIIERDITREDAMYRENQRLMAENKSLNNRQDELQNSNSKSFRLFTWGLVLLSLIFFLLNKFFK